MHVALGLRTKLYLTILPLILAVVLLSGVLSSIASRSALTPIATRLLAYKAEQLRDFTYSEWETIKALGLQDNQEFKTAAAESFLSYATSLLRTETELIVVTDSGGNIVMTIGGDTPEETTESVELEMGWFSGNLLDESRVGVVFFVEPHDWYVAVTELQSVYFTDAQAIFRTHVAISVVAVVLVTLLIWLFVGYQIKPIERLSSTIVDITETRDLSRRVDIEFTDEVGLLGHNFNQMISSLQENYNRLERAITAEYNARELAVAREEETLLLLGRVSEFRDQETADHLNRIALLSEILSHLLGHSDEETDLLCRASALHDIGKIAIPDSILLKPGKLTKQEFEEMKRHTVIGYELLKGSQSDYLAHGAEIALTHHEKWDGSGYPNGLTGRSIPLSGRIVAVVDVFDALTSERPYKNAWSPEAARNHIAGQRGRHFDPHLVDLFLEHYSEFRPLVVQ